MPTQNASLVVERLAAIEHALRKNDRYRVVAEIAEARAANPVTNFTAVQAFYDERVHFDSARDMVLLTEADVLRRFGTPSHVDSQTLGPTWVYRLAPAKSHPVVRIAFRDGLVVAAYAHGR